MSTMPEIAVSRLNNALSAALRDHDYDMSDAIATQAKASARALREHGWQGDGRAYDLGASMGDLEALRDLVGHEPNWREGRDLEKCIRICLTAQVDPLLSR